MIKLLSHLSYLEIAAPDVEASVRFYEEQVGLRVQSRANGKVYLEYRGLTTAAGSPCRTNGTPGGPASAGVQVPTLVQ